MHNFSVIVCLHWEKYEEIGRFSPHPRRRQLLKNQTDPLKIHDSQTDLHLVMLYFILNLWSRLFHRYCSIHIILHQIFQVFFLLCLGTEHLKRAAVRPLPAFCQFRSMYLICIFWNRLFHDGKWNDRCSDWRRSRSCYSVVA